MNTRTTLSLVAAARGLSAWPSLAQTTTAPAPDWTFTGNAGLFSDYRFRGVSQTNEQPAFQGGFDVAHSSGFYAGNWNSNIDSGAYADSNSRWTSTAASRAQPATSATTSGSSTTTTPAATPGSTTRSSMSRAAGARSR